jgi:hypothetical protein
MWVMPGCQTTIGHLGILNLFIWFQTANRKNTVQEKPQEKNTVILNRYTGAKTKYMQ